MKVLRGNAHKWFRNTLTIGIISIFLLSFVCRDAWSVIGESGLPFEFEKPIAGQYASLDVESFAVPAHLGEVRDFYRGSTNKLVVHIQDAHSNYYAQRKIANIVDFLNREYGIQALNLEGGVGDYNLDIFTAISDGAIREEVADYFVKRGEINGAELFAINNPDRVFLWGVEEKDLYVKNLKVYRDSLENRKDVEKYLGEIKHYLDNLKRNIYSPELLKIDLTYNSFKAKNITFQDYFEFLTKKAKDHSIDLANYPNLFLLNKALEQQEKINFKKANTERNRLVEELKNRLSNNEIRTLIGKTIEYKTKKSSTKVFFRYLIGKAKEVNIDTAKFPALNSYIEYVSTYESVDRSSVMDELDALEMGIKESIFKNDTQRELDKLSHNFTILTNFFDLRLNKKDYDYYMKNKRAFLTENFVSFIKKEAPRYKLPVRLNSNISMLDKYRSELENFFKFSFQRDKVFLRNMRFGAIQGGMTGAILMTGGFHADNLAELFKKEGVSYISVMPKFETVQGYESPYFDLLAGETNDLRSVIRSTIAQASFLMVAAFSSELGQGVWGEKGVQAFRDDVVIQTIKAILLGMYPGGYTLKVTGLKDANGNDVAPDVTEQGKTPANISLSVSMNQINRIVNDIYLDPEIKKAIDKMLEEGKEIDITKREDFKIAGKSGAEIREEVKGRFLEVAKELHGMGLHDEAKALEEIATDDVQINLLSGIEAKLFKAHPGGRGLHINEAAIEGEEDLKRTLYHDLAGGYAYDHVTSLLIESVLAGEMDVADLKGIDGRLRGTPVWGIPDVEERWERGRDPARAADPAALATSPSVALVSPTEAARAELDAATRELLESSQDAVEKKDLIDTLNKLLPEGNAIVINVDSLELGKDAIISQAQALAADSRLARSPLWGWLNKKDANSITKKIEFLERLGVSFEGGANYSLIYKSYPETTLTERKELIDRVNALLPESERLKINATNLVTSSHGAILKVAEAQEERIERRVGGIKEVNEDIKKVISAIEAKLGVKLTEEEANSLNSFMVDEGLAKNFSISDSDLENKLIGRAKNEVRSLWEISEPWEIPEDASDKERRDIIEMRKRAILSLAGYQAVIAEARRQDIAGKNSVAAWQKAINMANDITWGDKAARVKAASEAKEAAVKAELNRSHKDEMARIKMLSTVDINLTTLLESLKNPEKKLGRRKKEQVKSAREYLRDVFMKDKDKYKGVVEITPDIVVKAIDDASIDRAVSHAILRAFVAQEFGNLASSVADTYKSGEEEDALETARHIFQKFRDYGDNLHMFVIAFALIENGVAAGGLWKQLKNILGENIDERREERLQRMFEIAEKEDREGIKAAEAQKKADKEAVVRAGEQAEIEAVDPEEEKRKEAEAEYSALQTKASALDVAGADSVSAWQEAVRMAQSIPEIDGKSPQQLASAQRKLKEAETLKEQREEDLRKKEAEEAEAKADELRKRQAAREAAATEAQKAALDRMAYIEDLNSAISEVAKAVSAKSGKTISAESSTIPADEKNLSEATDDELKKKAKRKMLAIAGITDIGLIINSEMNPEVLKDRIVEIAEYDKGAKSQIEEYYKPQIKEYYGEGSAYDLIREALRVGEEVSNEEIEKEYFLGFGVENFVDENGNVVSLQEIRNRRDERADEVEELIEDLIDDKEEIKRKRALKIKIDALKAAFSIALRAAEKENSISAWEEAVAKAQVIPETDDGKRPQFDEAQRGLNRTRRAFEEKRLQETAARAAEIVDEADEDSLVVYKITPEEKRRRETFTKEVLDHINKVNREDREDAKKALQAEFKLFIKSNYNIAEGDLILVINGSGAAGEVATYRGISYETRRVMFETQDRGIGYLNFFNLGVIEKIYDVRRLPSMARKGDVITVTLKDGTTVKGEYGGANMDVVYYWKSTIEVGGKTVVVSEISELKEIEWAPETAESRFLDKVELGQEGIDDFEVLNRIGINLTYKGRPISSIEKAVQLRMDRVLAIYYINSHRLDGENTFADFPPEVQRRHRLIDQGMKLTPEEVASLEKIASVRPDLAPGRSIPLKLNAIIPEESEVADSFEKLINGLVVAHNSPEHPISPRIELDEIGVEPRRKEAPSPAGRVAATKLPASEPTPMTEENKERLLRESKPVNLRRFTDIKKRADEVLTEYRSIDGRVTEEDKILDVEIREYNFESLPGSGEYTRYSVGLADKDTGKLIIVLNSNPERNMSDVFQQDKNRDAMARLITHEHLEAVKGIKHSEIEKIERRAHVKDRDLRKTDSLIPVLIAKVLEYMTDRELEAIVPDHPNDPDKAVYNAAQDLLMERRIAEFMNNLRSSDAPYRIIVSVTEDQLKEIEKKRAVTDDERERKQARRTGLEALEKLAKKRNVHIDYYVRGNENSFKQTLARVTIGDEDFMKSDDARVIAFIDSKLEAARLKDEFGATLVAENQSPEKISGFPSEHFEGGDENLTQTVLHGLLGVGLIDYKAYLALEDEELYRGRRLLTSIQGIMRYMTKDDEFIEGLSKPENMRKFLNSGSIMRIMKVDINELTKQEKALRQVLRAL